MMESKHVIHHISDYVLDLLPGPERQLVEQHAAVCAECRQALQRESQVGVVVQRTLAAVAEAAPARLRQLRPALPARPGGLPFWRFTWPRQLAPLTLLLIVLLGSLSLHLFYRQPAWSSPSPTFLAVTATMTDEPTTTTQAAGTRGVQAAALWVETAAAATPHHLAGHLATVVTPAPVATPVAAVYALSSN